MNVVDRYKIDACDFILNKISPFQVFQIQNILENFDVTSYGIFVETTHGDEMIQLRDSTIERFMLNGGYITEMEFNPNSPSDFTLTDFGRIAKRLKGHLNFNEYLSLDLTIKSQLVEVNKSVIDTNIFTKTNIAVTFLMTLVSSAFIGISTWKSCTDKSTEATNTQLELIRKELMNNRAKSDSILSYLIDKGFLKASQKSFDSTNKDSTRK